VVHLFSPFQYPYIGKPFIWILNIICARKKGRANNSELGELGISTINENANNCQWASSDAKAKKKEEDSPFQLVNMLFSK
jgi:hypothetical protein